MVYFPCKNILNKNIIKRVVLLAGQIYNIIQSIVTQKSKGNSIIANNIKTKMYLKGIAVDKYTPSSPDDVAIIQKLHAVAQEFGVNVF